VYLHKTFRVKSVHTPEGLQQLRRQRFHEEYFIAEFKNLLSP
jgi:hypothetical protein